MSTLAQIEANRRNAQLSTGPKTLEGKQAARRNALKHGYLSHTIPADDADFHRMHADLRQALKPFDQMQSLLVEQIALAYLRLQRLLTAEVHDWQKEAQAEDPSAEIPPADSAALPLRLRYETMLTHQIQRNMTLFQEVRKRALWRLQVDEYDALMARYGYDQKAAEQEAAEQQDEEPNAENPDPKPHGKTPPVAPPIDQSAPRIETSDSAEDLLARCKAARLAEERALNQHIRSLESST